MAQRPISFLVVLLLIFYGENFGQENPHFKGKILDDCAPITIHVHHRDGDEKSKQIADSLYAEYYIKCDKTNNKTGVSGGCWAHLNKPVVIDTTRIKILPKLPINYNKLANFNFENQLKLDYQSKHTSAIKTTMPLYLFKMPLRPYIDYLGFVCKKELQWDKITVMPVRFRLGSLNYVNWMEQKPNSNKE